MTSQIALRRAVAHEPDDDAARLVYADWLEENGAPERAEFVRTQLRLAELLRDQTPLPDFPITFEAEERPGQRALAFRCRELLDAHEEEWLAPLRVLGVREWTWSRGLVETLDLLPEALGSFAAEVFDLHPIRRLLVRRLGGQVELLRVIPADNHLASLDLVGGDIDLAGLRRLAGYEHFPHLKELGLQFNRLDDSAVETLCGGDFFQRLTTIRLCCNGLSAEGRQRLREHFGDRFSFSQASHPERIFALRASAHLHYSASGGSLMGWGPNQTQLLMEMEQVEIVMAVLDHAGNLLRIERRPIDQHDAPAHTRAMAAWQGELGYRPATIKVKPFTGYQIGGFFDFPKEYGETIHMNAEEQDIVAESRRVLNRWLDEDLYRYGSYCGGWYFKRLTGEPAAVPEP